MTMDYIQTMDCSPWGSKNWLKIFMQTKVGVTCMQTNYLKLHVAQSIVMGRQLYLLYLQIALLSNAAAK